MNLNGKPGILISMKRLLFFIAGVTLLLAGCGDDFPYRDYIGYASFEVTNQFGETVDFPSEYEGSILVAGFIFTHCPDICPLTTLNMKRVQEAMREEGIDNVEFAAISFDPSRDTPESLKEYADLRNITQTNFDFLTGPPERIDSLMKLMHIVYVSGDTTYTESGKPVYFYQHTDRITLIDQQNRIRKEYPGSTLELKTIVEDIKKLKD